MKLTKAMLIVPFALAAMALPCVAQNLLANPSFEDPITDDGPPFVGFWESFSLDGDQFTGGDIARNSTLMPRTGVQSLELIIDNVPGSFAGVFQDVPVSPGDVLTYSVWVKSLGEPGGSEARIEWRDSVANTEVSRTSNMDPGAGSTYELFSFDATAPAGADTARITYAIQSFGGALNQQLFLDDFSAVIVPEPATFSLMALAGLMCIGARRRQS